MQIKKRKLKVFVGYQINSEYHDTKELKETIFKVKKNIEEEFSNIELDIKFGEFGAGKVLFNEVLNAIKECEIAIFDISENNPNVLIEVGMAYGNNKQVVLLKNELSKERFRVPTDISAFVYVPYRDKKAIYEIRDEIANSISTYLKESSKSLLYFKSLWGFDEAEQVYIVCPELEEPEKRQYPEPQEFLYLGKYGDIDSLIVVYSSLNKIYPQLSIKFCTSEEFKSIPGNPYASNLILIGGPDYNKVTESFMKYTPFEFSQNENDETILIYNQRNQVFEPKFKLKKEIEEVVDYGFFLKIPNPYNPDKKLIMINGIHTYGVYGAAKCFSLYDEHEINIAKDNCKTVIETLGDDPHFAVIVKVECINKKIGIPQIRKEELISL